MCIYMYLYVYIYIYVYMLFPMMGIIISLMVGSSFSEFRHVFCCGSAWSGRHDLSNSVGQAGHQQPQQKMSKTTTTSTIIWKID